jgi:hypothetical protein
MKLKRLSAVLILGFVIVFFCAAQYQDGNASYNPSKQGFKLSHPTISFNARVRITNLENNRSVEAVVDGRIPPKNEPIADIFRDAGDALEMNKSGMTRVRIEELPPRTAAQNSVPAEPLPVRETVPTPAAPPPVVTPVTPAPVQQEQNQTPPPPQILPVQTVTEYIQVPAVPAQPCCAAPLLLAILLLLILLIILLVVFLVLLLRRFPLWPWHYPFSLRRYYYRYRQQRN